MKLYTVFMNMGRERPYEDVIAVAEGFSIYAAIFQGLWALYKKMWLVFIILTVIGLVFGFLEREGLLSFNVLVVFQFGLLVYVGFSAQDWYRSSLARKGYTLVDVVSAKDPGEAQKFFFERHTEKKRGEDIIDLGVKEKI